MPDRLYCTLAELIDDLDLNGLRPRDEKKAMKNIQDASDFLDQKIGQFVPVVESRTFNGKGGKILFIPPLLAVTSITNDGTTLSASDYVLYSGNSPGEPYWDNGPYTSIHVGPDSTSLTAWSSEEGGIVITGFWGKYRQTKTTETTVANTTEISSSGTALQVANGSKVSPGMILLLENEQVLVRATGARSSVASLLAEALDAQEEEVNVDNGAHFNIGEVMRVDVEDMLIDDIGGNTLVVQRGWNKTTPAAHNDDSSITVYRTYTIERGINGTTAAAHANGTAISRYVQPGDLNWLCRQIAGLMKNKARGGFAGKSGSPELGTIFYHDEFPKSQLEKVHMNYGRTF